MVFALPSKIKCILFSSAILCLSFMCLLLRFFLYCWPFLTLICPATYFLSARHNDCRHWLVCQTPPGNGVCCQPSNKTGQTTNKCCCSFLSLSYHFKEIIKISLFGFVWIQMFKIKLIWVQCQNFDGKIYFINNSW